MQVGLAMLFRRLPVEHCNRQRIGNRNGGDAPASDFEIDRIQKFPDCHERKSFVTMNGGQYAKRRAIFLPGQHMKAET